MGCWDSDSYTGFNWDTRDGAQPRFFMNMIGYVQGTVGERVTVNGMFALFGIKLSLISIITASALVLLS